MNSLRLISRFEAPAASSSRISISRWLSATCGDRKRDIRREATGGGRTGFPAAPGRRAGKSPPGRGSPPGDRRRRPPGAPRTPAPPRPALGTGGGPPARATARRTAQLPSRLVRHIGGSPPGGWIAQARWTTASAPASTRASRSAAPSAPRSQVHHSAPVYGATSSGRRRATPTTCHDPRARTARNSAVPTLPEAPVTTTRTRPRYPDAGRKTPLTERPSAGFKTFGYLPAGDSDGGYHSRGPRA